MKIFLIILLTALIAACGGGSSSNDNDGVVPPVTGVEQAKFSVGLSDAPVDDAIAVVLEIDTVKIIKLNDAGDSSEEILVEDFAMEDGSTATSVVTNLLDYQGAD